MTDLQKVIKGLECCITDGTDCPNDCPYIGDCNRKQLHTDALVFLKGLEQVKPTLDIRHGKSMWRCGSCSTALQPNHINAKFCFNCGRAVKWDD